MYTSDILSSRRPHLVFSSCNRQREMWQYVTMSTVGIRWGPAIWLQQNRQSRQCRPSNLHTSFQRKMISGYGSNLLKSLITILTRQWGVFQWTLLSSQQSVMSYSPGPLEEGPAISQHRSTPPPPAWQQLAAILVLWQQSPWQQQAAIWEQSPRGSSAGSLLARSCSQGKCGRVLWSVAWRVPPRLGTISDKGHQE